MDDNKNTEVEKQNVTETEEQPKNDGTGSKEEKQLDGDKLVKKLQKRIGKEQNEKHSLQDQLDKANEKIKQLQSGKSIKDLSDEDKAKKAESDKDKKIVYLEEKIHHRDKHTEQDEVIKNAG